MPKSEFTVFDEEIKYCLLGHTAHQTLCLQSDCAGEQFHRSNLVFLPLDAMPPLFASVSRCHPQICLHGNLFYRFKITARVTWFFRNTAKNAIT